jgi:hypothetical protein
MSHFIEATTTSGRKTILNLESANVITDGNPSLVNNEEVPSTLIVWDQSKIEVHGSIDELRARPRVRIYRRWWQR